jgi:hypothetical protein
MTFKEQTKEFINQNRLIPINHAPKRKEILSSDEKNLHFAMHCAILMQTSC